ncbi:hypothetical protein BROUX41_001931 [Berkeleyomyces rouxiae]|uniref:uncharacterized protein n=1 Tax=Berkeleyomyces rouxiae TaxID=2035830 RepID=UPI003B7F3938
MAAPLPVPDFSDRRQFPGFRETPTTAGPHVLLGTYKENMTIMRPTYIVEDRDGVQFAMTFMIANDSPARPGFKKGAAVALCGLAREEPAKAEAGAESSGKAGFVRVQPGEEARVVGLGRAPLDRFWAAAAAAAAGCAGCGKDDETQAMKRCTNCGWVKYCKKECQIEGWNNKGHKGDCRAFGMLQAALRGAEERGASEQVNEE